MKEAHAHLVPTSAQKRVLRPAFEPSRVVTSTFGSERASRKARRLPVMAASKRACVLLGDLGLGGGGGIIGPSRVGLSESSGGESWTSWVATTRGMER